MKKYVRYRTFTFLFPRKRRTVGLSRSPGLSAPHYMARLQNVKQLRLGMLVRPIFAFAQDWAEHG
jgi:hypothetical protein